MEKTPQSPKPAVNRCLCAGVIALASLATVANAQLIDKTLAPNVASEGTAKSLADQIGVGRGDIYTPGSSAFIIARDPFRSVRRGRQLFQRKFTMEQGVGPRVQDGKGEVNTILAIGAGLADSCAACHGRPRGAAGFGGDVATRPDSRDAPHLFGLGLKEMLADEITRICAASVPRRLRRQPEPIARSLYRWLAKGSTMAGWWPNPMARLIRPM